MLTRRQNPYMDTLAVRRPEMFYGRRELLRRVFSAIANRQSVSLVGPRQIGKSAVLSCMRMPSIQQEFEIALTQLILVPLDLREYLSKSTEDFFTEVSEQILHQSRKLHIVDPAHLKGARKFSAILRQIEEQSYHPVLLMDSFDSVTRNVSFDLGFFSFLRSQATLGLVSYVTASIAPLGEVCHNDIKTSPFFNIFSVRYVEPLSMEEARQLIIGPMERAGVPVSEEDVQHVLNLAGRHPYCIQRVCHFLFEEKDQHSPDHPDYKHCSGQAYEDLKPNFDATWERLNKDQQELLRSEARRSDAGKRELPELSESSLMREFVREKLNIALFEITMENLRDFLDKIDDNQFLGECDLRHLKSVIAQMKQGSITSIERGILVRKVLHEAFERLRVRNGVRRDSSPEWRLYNILYYRYFSNYHLSNEQIAARLEYSSTRKYYRERNRAVDALLKILQEMERQIQDEG